MGNMETSIVKDEYGKNILSLKGDFPSEDEFYKWYDDIPRRRQEREDEEERKKEAVSETESESESESESEKKPKDPMVEEILKLYEKIRKRELYKLSERVYYKINENKSLIVFLIKKFIKEHNKKYDKNLEVVYIENILISIFELIDIYIGFDVTYHNYVVTDKELAKEGDCVYFDIEKNNKIVNGILKKLKKYEFYWINDKKIIETTSETESESESESESELESESESESELEKEEQPKYYSVKDEDIDIRNTSYEDNYINNK